MTSDLFTKPLQGKIFNKLRAITMVWETVDSLNKITQSTSNERVGKQVSEDDEKKASKKRKQR